MVQGVILDVNKDQDKFLGLVETPAQFHLGDDVGCGMMEFAFFSEFDKYTG